MLKSHDGVLEIEKVMHILSAANIVFPHKATVSIYHHAGKDKFSQMGAVFINTVNRNYCKSYVVMQSGQAYPIHYHKIKQESFYILYGKVKVVIDGQSNVLNPGEMIHIERGIDHSFECVSVKGAVFEEISTEYLPNDSVYLDHAIQNKTYDQKRTLVDQIEWEEVCKIWNK